MTVVAQLYHCVAARSFRPLWTLEEIGLKYELIMLPFPPRVRAKDFLKINSLGTVPVLMIGGHTLTESVAMCEYLAGRFDTGGLAIAPHEGDYGAYLNWLYYGEATLTFPQALILRYGQFEPEPRRSRQIVEDYSRWFLARLRRLTEALDGREFLCGGRFSVADISVGYAVVLASRISSLRDRLDRRIVSYVDRLKDRPSFQRASAAEVAAALAQGIDSTPITSIT